MTNVQGPKIASRAYSPFFLLLCVGGQNHVAQASRVPESGAWLPIPPCTVTSSHSNPVVAGLTPMSAISSTLPTPLDTRATSPAPINPRDITDPSQIPAQLALLARREADLSLALNALVSDRAQIDNALTRLKDLSGYVGHIAGELDGAGPSRTNGHVFALSSRGLGQQNGEDGYYEEEDEGLVERVRKVWETSERVGGKVRSLDEEVGRVKESADIVSEVLELKVGRAI